MSLGANEPVDTAKRTRTTSEPASPARGAPSAKLARFGVPVPPRIAQFFDGPELAAYEGVKAWGFSGFSSDTKMKVKWASPRLAQIYEYATDGYFEGGAQDRFLPIAAVGSESYMFAVDVTSPTLAVYFFDYEEGFKEYAPDFDAFLGKLLKKGEKTPGERLTNAYEQARELHDGKQFRAILDLLVPLVAEFPVELDAWDDTRDTVGACHNLIGIAHENLGDIAAAQHSYTVAERLGTDSAALNVCDLYLNHFKDYGKLVEYAEDKREGIWRVSDNYAWFHIRNYLGQAYLLTGRPRDAIRAYHQILDGVANEDPEKLAEAISDLKTLVAERPEADRDTATSILSWLDAPPPTLPADRLGAMRGWWAGLPAKVQATIREAVKLDEGAEPSDGDLARIAELDDLDCSHHELTDISWVAMLAKLDDLDLEGNAIVDLTPLGTLVRLTRLDVSENQVKSLRPLGSLVRLQRLSAGENPLSGLEGVETLRELSYLHVIEAKLKSVEPLRGLPELEELSIYNNAIDDLSPLAECPRLKEISSFGNPLATGLAALASLPRLEKVDAGEQTRRAEAKALAAANPIVRIDHVFAPADDGDDDEDEDESEEVTAPSNVDPAEVRAWWSALPAPWRARLHETLDRDERDREPSDEALVKLVEEDSLHVDDKPLPDLEPLRRFERVDFLAVGKTGISDLSPIARLPRLTNLIVRDNPISSVAPLGESRVIEELYMERCQVRSLAGLDGCTTLRELYAEDNQLEDIGALASLRELRVVDLEGNRITSIEALRGLPKLRVVRLGLNAVTDLSPLADCPALREVEIWANPGVKGARGLAECAALVRVVSHGSLPAAELQYLREIRPDLKVD